MRSPKRQKGEGGACVSSGADTDGKEYGDIEHMWNHELKDVVAKGSGDQPEWYKKGVDYWEDTVEATVDGVLGGFGCVSPADVEGSTTLIKKLFKEIPVNGPRTVLDCGAGIGRVTKELLMHHFDVIDLVEPCKKFIDKAKDYIGSDKVQNYYHMGLEQCVPEAGRYDVVWIQWCIGHLTDDDCRLFLKRAQQGLKLGGFVVVKENNTPTGFLVDKEDSSVTRSNALFKALFESAGLKLIHEDVQTKFPRDLFKVRMYAMQ